MRDQSTLRALCLLLLCGGTVCEVAKADSSRNSPFQAVEQLARTLVLVENFYVQPVDRAKLVQGAIKGMVSELDPHSVYMIASDYETFRNEAEGRFVGIGVEVDVRDGIITVIRPIEESPAARAGIQPGDQIVAIDGWATRGHQLDRVLDRIRGERNTAVRLHVRRPLSDTLISMSIVRGDVRVRSVFGTRLDNNIAYVVIKQFQRGTHSEFLEVMGGLRLASDSPLVGIILDLRTNPGGLVHESVLIADELLESGVIFTSRARGRVLDQAKASPGGAASRLPLIVLVNELSASAAELVAGSIQDNRRGLLVGTTTFGKGSVQSVVELPGGDALKLTTTLYYTPSGRTIQAHGITPDVVVKQPSSGNGMPVSREQDIEGHIPPPDAPEEKPDHSEVTTLDIVFPRDSPANPVGRGDLALSVAYQLLLDELNAHK